MPMPNELNRRRFLQKSSVVAAAATFSPELATTLLAQPGPATGRQVLPINRGWRYRDTATVEARAAGFDDSSFAQVCLPHTNVRLPWHGFNEKAFQFVSVYRRPIKLPADAKGKRVFLDFEGVMLATTVYLNGKHVGGYKGGYTPFSFDLTDMLDYSGGPNLLAVEVDSSERADIPPFGNEVDYLTFGGIYREVSLRIVPQVSIENFVATPVHVLSPNPSVQVRCWMERAANAPDTKQAMTVRVELRDGARVLAVGTAPVSPTIPRPLPNDDAGQALGALPLGDGDKPQATLELTKLGKVELWELRSPKLYTVHVQLMASGRVVDEDVRRIGFREANFTEQGFSLNGKVVKLHGLDRHQTFPWVGQAMPARVQRQDAVILRKQYHCNIVRTSHYPQSRHFLDACDEIGLLVLEEIPGWQHIGPKPWQDISVDNVRRMVRRDWNHPSVILWGVRINESQDNHDFYTRTNALARGLDPSRQTGGIRYLYNSEFLEDVFTMNDFGWPMLPPNHKRYLNTEFVGHTFPTKTIDALERLKEHTHRHARIFDHLATNAQYAGGIGWCAFDYNTHYDFGSGDHICYHGVFDIWRTPKPAAGLYKSMCDAAEEPVLEMGHHWARNDESINLTSVYLCSNCDTLRLTMKDKTGMAKVIGEGGPDRRTYPNLPYAPFDFPVKTSIDVWGDLHVEGFVGGKKVIERTWSGSGIDAKFALVPDGTTLVADGTDTTRVVLQVNDEYGNIRPYAADAITFKLEGPAELIGDNPFGLIGGTGAVWVRAKESASAGVVTLHAEHPILGSQSVQFTLTGTPAESA